MTFIVLFLLLALAGPGSAASRVDAAIDALRNDSSLKVRTQAAVVLGQRGAAEAVPSLREAVAGDGSAAVRIAAIGALLKLRARVARPTLKAARESDPDEAVRSVAARALDALGPVTVLVERPLGTPAMGGAAFGSLVGRLRELGFSVGEGGELRLKPTSVVDEGSSAISARVSVIVVDGDGHIEMMEASARAALSGALPEAKVASTTAKVVDAATRGVCQDLAARLLRR